MGSLLVVNACSTDRVSVRKTTSSLMLILCLMVFLAGVLACISVLKLEQ